MAQTRTRKIVITGVMGAISIFLGVTRWGFIPWFGGISLTIMHVPVIIGAVLEGPVVGVGVGLLFGLFSLIQAAVAPNSPADAWFVNPLLSVLPRLFIGPAAYYCWKLLEKVPTVGLVVSGMMGSVTNTVLVLGVIGLMQLLPWEVIGGIIIANGLLEAALSAFITLVVVAAWRQIKIGKREGSDL